MKLPMLDGYFISTWVGAMQSGNAERLGQKLFNLAYLSFAQILDIYGSQSENSVTFEYSGWDAGLFIDSCDFLGTVSVALGDIWRHCVMSEIPYPIENLAFLMDLYGRYCQKHYTPSESELLNYRGSVLYLKIWNHYIKEA